MFGLPLSGTGEIYTTVWISTKIYHLQLWLDCQFCSVITLGVILLLFLISLSNYLFCFILWTCSVGYVICILCYRNTKDPDKLEFFKLLFNSYSPFPPSTNMPAFIMSTLPSFYETIDFLFEVNDCSWISISFIFLEPLVHLGFLTGQQPY